MNYRQGPYGGYAEDEAAGTQRAAGGGPRWRLRDAYMQSGGAVNAEECEDYAPTETARQFKDPHFIYGHERVRRLTPLECERLQGFPDGWTDIPYKGKEHAPDGPRYKALGNSFAVPVVRWIGERIQMVEEVRDELSDGHSLL